MAIASDGDVAGYISGGCVEGTVTTEARRVIETGKPVLLDYGAGSPMLDVQLTCGGRIRIFVRAIPDLASYAARLRTACENRTALDVAIDLDTGEDHFETISDRLRNQDHVFIKTYLPKPRLIVVGCDPITVSLCRLAPYFGFEIGLLTPYGPASPPLGVAPFYYDTRQLKHSLKDLSIDESTAVYTLTHSLDDDHEVLLHALRSPAFAVGVLGSRLKIEERRRLLDMENINQSEIQRLNAPAGLDINAHNPSEIALSILAELVAKRPRTMARSRPRTTSCVA